MQSHLFLIGTVHHDPRGYAKLYAALTMLKPDFITLELSPYGRGFRTRHHKKLTQRLLSFCREVPATILQDASPETGSLPSPVQALMLTVKYPFEFLAARDYAHAYRVPFYCIDLSSVSRQKMRILKQEALSKNNIRMLLMLPDKNLQESVELCYKKVQNIWDRNSDGKKALPANYTPSVFEREAHMSRRIRNLVRRHPEKIIVHIGGCEHITEGTDHKNLCELLGDLSPQRMLLTEEGLSAITPLP